MRAALLVLCVAALCGLASVARADTATDVGTGYTSSNAAGQISGGLLHLDDANGHGTPAANVLQVLGNDSGSIGSPSCDTIGADKLYTPALDTDTSSAYALTECYEAKKGRVVYTGADGSVLATVVYDAAGNASRVQIWGQANTVDQADAAIVGTLDWAIATVTSGGLVTLNPGSYYVKTPGGITITKSLTLEGIYGGAKIIAQGAAFDGDMLRVDGGGTQLEGVVIRDLEFNGNKGNVTGSVLIHSTDAKIRIEDIWGHDWKTGGILLDASAATASSIVNARVVDSHLFNGLVGTYGIKTTDNAGSCLTDVIIQRNTMGAAPIIVDECINGLQLEGNHIYGYLTDQACVQATVADPRWDWRISNNTIEDCGREAITISGGGADRGEIENNTFYCEGRTADATYNAVNLSGVDASIISGNNCRACAATGIPLHCIATSTASSNNHIVGNAMIGNSTSSDTVSITGGSGNTVVANRCEGTCNYAAALSSSTSNVVALNYCIPTGTGTCTGHVSDTTLSDMQFNPDATYGWLMKDGLGVLPDGSNGVAVNSSGVLAKVGTGSVVADEVTCTGCVSTTEVAAGVTLDSEWSTAAAINAVTSDDDFMTLTSTQVADWGGAKIELPNGTATTAGDCDAAGEAGRIFVDTDALASTKLKICGGAGGWENAGPTFDPTTFSVTGGVVALGTTVSLLGQSIDISDETNLEPGLGVVLTDDTLSAYATRIGGAPIQGLSTDFTTATRYFNSGTGATTYALSEIATQEAINSTCTARNFKVYVARVGSWPAGATYTITMRKNQSATGELSVNLNALAGAGTASTVLTSASTLAYTAGDTFGFTVTCSGTCSDGATTLYFRPSADCLVD